MPPVRWKLSIVTFVCLLQTVFYTDGQIRQDEISTDGWKPIIGTRKPSFYESFSTDSSDFFKYDILSTLPPTVTALPPTVTAGPSQRTVILSGSPKPVFRGSPKPLYFPGRKVPHQKYNLKPDPFFALTRENHGPHIPLSAVVHTRPSQIGHIKQHVTSSKPFVQATSTNKRNSKPVRVQTSTSNYRDDIFTAAATSGNFNLYKHRGSNIRTRETLDLGLPGANHYTINQPHAHFDFTSSFAIPSPSSESVFEQYNNPSLQAFVFGKHPQSNDINLQVQSQNDEFTRNLIPPPQVYKNKDPVNRVKPNENVVLQIPPTFQFNAPKINEPQVQVQVTKEKLHEFHNSVPPNYHGQYIQYDFTRKPTTAPQYDLSDTRKPSVAPQYNFADIRKPIDTSQYDFSKIKKPVVVSQYDFSEATKPTPPSKPSYEVTEGKDWQEPASQQPLRIRKPTQIKRRPNFDDDVPVFLPTPYEPEKPTVEPTSPTQSEVSTIFTKLSQLQREKEVTSPDPFAFNVKEVSTHYPIFGKPIFNEPHSSPEISNEITTLHEEVATTTTKEPERVRPHRRRRPERRRTTTTTTESPAEDVQMAQEIESHHEETERPVRIKRPNRYRTTTPSTSSEETSVKINRGRNRYRHHENLNYEPTRIRTRPPTLETTTLPDNHKSEEVDQESSQLSMEAEEAASERSEEVEEVEDYPNSETVEIESERQRDVPQRVRYQTIRPFIIITTTEKAPTTNLVVPENEVDDDATSLPGIEETTTTTAAPTTTMATTTTTTTNSHRIRGRPIKFDNSNRPRFSVKDYRQKLYQSTTSTPQPHKTTDSVRIRMPSRLRRPSITTSSDKEEESTEPARSKFVPKDARHHSTTEANNVAIITEKNIKSVNTRLRPFGRYKTTAATTTAPKVSIKPNLFTRKRPPMLTLRGKIFNRYNKNNTEPTTEKITTTEENEDETTEANEEEQEIEVTSTTELNLKNFKTTEDAVDSETTTMGDISKIDPLFYSQRVSDLTSSAKNDYDTPGLFKSVAPTSRRIPNYFTIATDDPILPIEAFFPSIKEKNPK